MFHQAISHCRHKSTLKRVISTIRLQDFSTCLTFEEIFANVEKVCKPIYGIGTLSVYDLSTDIAKHYGLQPKMIYCIGNGPRTALCLLGIKPIIQKLGSQWVQATTTSAVQHAFHQKGLSIPEKLYTSTNPDDWESFLCIWQKQFTSGSATGSHIQQHYKCRGTSNSSGHT
jgi:hypothetical protein